MSRLAVTNEDILGAISSFVQMVSERFDAIEERLDAVEKRLGVIEERLDEVEKRLDVVEHDVSKLAQVSYRQEQNFGKTIALLERAHLTT